MELRTIMTLTERNNILTLIRDQLQETVDQETAGVTIRMAIITCPCGNKGAVVKTYQCLYCNIWFCHSCAEGHFGKTVKEHQAEHVKSDN